MDYAAILKADKAQGLLNPKNFKLPAAPTTPPVSDDQEQGPDSIEKRRAQAAVYATAQEGTVAGFPVQPPNY